MVKQITHGVSITVESFYDAMQSSPIDAIYLFAYRITIENFSEIPVKLLRRHWYIIDTNGTYREVEGEGVVGQQPVIEPGKSYQYVSAANLKTDIGKMYGTYTMQDMYSQKLITVQIPEFQLIAPFKRN
jgi:ApaG protein